MTDYEELLKLNQEGFIPGPKEDLSLFLKRVELTKNFFEDPNLFFENHKREKPFNFNDRVKKPNFEWVKNTLFNLFGFTAQPFAFFSNEKLSIIHGAATWILKIDNIALPILQLRKGFKKGTYLFYDMEEILAHELCHFARAAFDEPKYEELFAYWTSSSIFRRIFGPIISQKLLYFLLPFFLALLFQYLNIFFPVWIFHLIFFFFTYYTLGVALFGIFNLFFKRWKFNRCFKKIFSILLDKNKTSCTIFRLTDKEIDLFSKLKKEQIEKYIENEKSHRWQIVKLAYFNER